MEELLEGGFDAVYFGTPRGARVGFCWRGGQKGVVEVAEMAEIGSSFSLEREYELLWTEVWEGLVRWL